MNTSKVALLLSVTCLATLHAGEARYFRVSGPAPSSIISLSQDGHLTWSIRPFTNATFVIQSAQSLAAPVHWVDFVQVPVTQAISTHWLFNPNPPTNMVLIPPGVFTMGDVLGDSRPEWGALSLEQPLRTNYVSAFYLEETLVTQAQWTAVYTWATNHGYRFENPGSGKAANHPVHSVSWYDAVKWCNARSEQAGLVPAYYTDAGQRTVYKAGQLDLTNGCVRWNAGYRLPTEAEWEKAARGGAIGQRFPWGTTIDHTRANYYSSSNDPYDVDPLRGLHPAFASGGYPFTSPVTYFPPNGYGLHDMAGNVATWCWDWFDWYPDGSEVDPRGPSTVVACRVVRGGWWSCAGNSTRCSARTFHIPTQTDLDSGFRCARGI